MILPEFPEAPNGLVLLGVQLHKALEQKGIKSLSDCIKKCASAGSGIPATVADIANQICFGVDYDFGSHKYLIITSTVSYNYYICTLITI